MVKLFNMEFNINGKTYYNTFLSVEERSMYLKKISKNNIVLNVLFDEND